MSEPQQNQDEELREFESEANKTCIARQHAMEAAERTCLGLRIEIQQLTKERDAESSRADEAETVLKSAEAILQGRLGAMPNAVEQACREYVAAEDALPDWFDTEDYCLSGAVISLARIAKERDKAEAACAEMRETLAYLKQRESKGYLSYLGFRRIYVPKIDHALSSDCGHGHIPVESLLGEATIKKLVDSFVAWPLPDSVCSDQCACIKGYRHRTGTNLLTAEEARQMFECVLKEL